MALDQHAENLITLTNKAFGGDANSVSMTDGISLIDSWTSFLKSDPSTGNDVLAGLNDLRSELAKGNPDTTQVQHLLQNLSQQTEKLAGTVDADDKSTLTTLAGSLHGLSQQIAGTGHPAPTGGEAPIASTVGGESSRSGSGASALRDDEDDLTQRQGGTRDDDGGVDYMDDTTGSDGGVRAGEAEDDSAYSPQDDNSSAKPSRSNASHVSGMGVSGGTADSESSQSEGRSQY